MSNIADDNLFDGLRAKSVAGIYKILHMHKTCLVVKELMFILGSVSYPLINNLPASISIAEDITMGTSIFTVGVTDADVGDTHTFTLYAVDPAASIAEFYINPSSRYCRAPVKQL